MNTLGKTWRWTRSHKLTIIRMLLTFGDQTIADLSEMTGISKKSVDDAVCDLESEGIVRSDRVQWGCYRWELA